MRLVDVARTLGVSHQRVHKLKNSDLKRLREGSKITKTLNKNKDYKEN